MVYGSEKSLRVRRVRRYVYVSATMHSQEDIDIAITIEHFQNAMRTERFEVTYDTIFFKKSSLRLKFDRFGVYVLHIPCDEPRTIHTVLESQSQSLLTNFQ